MTVILGDNIFLGLNRQFEYKNNVAKIFLKRVNYPESFGIAPLKNEEIIGILEKPKTFISNLAVTGLYQYPRCGRLDRYAFYI